MQNGTPWIRRGLPAGLAVALLLGGCGPYEPIVDRGRADFNPVAYEHDLAQCRAYARQIDAGEQAVSGGVLGAAAGAAFGAIGGAFAGNAGSGAALGASVGGLGGALGGAGDATERQERVVRNCLAGRGYFILD
ncbi:MAG: hypothetical protein GVY13_04790 [Alphaproteobacteria bacterium]|nr:hypothetical protein [Alphaproteobacteria bacterium]